MLTLILLLIDVSFETAGPSVHATLWNGLSSILRYQKKIFVFLLFFNYFIYIDIIYYKILLLLFVVTNALSNLTLTLSGQMSIHSQAGGPSPMAGVGAPPAAA
jgi:hypothetical protein